MTKFIKNTVDAFGLIGFVVAAAILILLSGGGYFLFKAYLPGEFSVACTQEAKQCPDGSYVGRTGSNCEFAECPVSCEECDRIIVGKCEPDFVVEKGPELTASEAYSEECTSKASKAACEQVDIFNKAKGTFGNTDGTPDCKWVESAEIIDTSIWQTYRNEKYGFEVKYPSDWEVSEKGLPHNSNYFITLKNIQEQFDVHLLIKENSERLNAKDYALKFFEDFEKTGIGGVKIIDKFYINLENIMAYEVEILADEELSEEIYITNQDYAYKFSIPAVLENQPYIEYVRANNKISHQILSTFKFLK